mmetsp:Transcript_43692/g.108736  ORF Transcript_43692/g.108736 Transcript_43692/m.108736 type:complete len:92 (+) Transcript_43692:231-506(+)
MFSLPPFLHMLDSSYAATLRVLEPAREMSIVEDCQLLMIRILQRHHFFQSTHWLTRKSYTNVARYNFFITTCDQGSFALFLLTWVLTPISG